MKIVFYYPGSEFDGNTLNERPLGGTETAVIYIAKELSAIGLDVSVYNNSKKNMVIDNVKYKNFNDFNFNENINIFVGVRFPEIFAKKINSKINLFWTEDNSDQPFLKPLIDKSIVSNIDKIITVSNWQTKNISSFFKIPEEKFLITRNGVNLENFKADIIKNKNKLIYTNAPFRGLDVLLDIFPEIKKEVPFVELHVFSSMKVYNVSEEEDKKSYKDIYEKTKQPAVFLRGSVKQKELAKELLSSYLMIYPNTFAETSCIAAIEAQAAGIPVVTSKKGALMETVEQGILIEGYPYSEKYKKEFVEKVLFLLKNEEEWKKLSEIGKNRVKERYNWEIIAKEWKAEFINLLKNYQKTKTEFENAKEFFDKKDFDNAIVYFNKYLEKNPNDYSSYFYLALAYDEKNDYKNAVINYKKTLELNPKAENAYNNLALLYIKIKDYKNAYTTLTKAIKLGHPKKEEMLKLAKEIKNKLDGNVKYSFSFE